MKLKKYARLLIVANRTKGENGMLAVYHLANAMSILIRTPFYVEDSSIHYNRARFLIRQAKFSNQPSAPAETNSPPSKRFATIGAMPKPKFDA